MRWIILIGIYILIDIYAFQALKTITSNKLWHYSYLLLSLAVIANLIIQNLIPQEGSVVSGARSYAFGFLLALIVPKLFLVIIMFAEDLLRFIVALYYRFFSTESSLTLPSRRKFVSTIALGIAAIPFASLLYGMYRGKYNFKVLKYELSFDDLPEAFDGYQITQISDVHSGSFDNRDKIAYAINLINEQQSDAIFFTGDMVNNKAEEMEPWKDLFGSLKAKDGVFSILGNHDYGDYVQWVSESDKAANLDQLKTLQKDMGYDLLLNDYRRIQRGTDTLNIVGVENWGAGGFVKHGDIEKASAGLTKEDFKILLSHDPSYWQENIKSNDKHFQLTLSGHTHGMQFGIEIPGFLRWSPVQYRYKNWAGIYEEFGRYINVNRGFGFLGYPGRVGIWPEVTVITLKRNIS